MRLLWGTMLLRWLDRQAPEAPAQNSELPELTRAETPATAVTFAVRREAAASLEAAPAAAPRPSDRVAAIDRTLGGRMPE
jgi:hypothetical protein